MKGTLQAALLAVIATLLGPLSSAQDNTFEIRGATIDINDKPLPYVAVALQSKEPARELNEVTDRNGAFSFAGLTAGSYSLRTKLGGLNPVVARVLTVGPERPILTLRLRIEAGGCPLTPSLAHYFRSLDPQGKSKLSAFSGTVIDENGSPIEGATAALYTPTRGKIASTHTSNDGTFFFTDLKVDKDYWIQVLSNGYFTGEFTNLESLRGYESVYDDLTLEACDEGNCDPSLRKIQTIRCE